MKDKRITRLLRLLQMLQSGPGKNATALAKAFGVARRTIFRDLQNAPRRRLAARVRCENRAVLCVAELGDCRRPN